MQKESRQNDLKSVSHLINSWLEINPNIDNDLVNFKLTQLHLPNLLNKQINNYKYRFRNSNPTCNKNSNLSHLIDWAKANREIPADPNKVFCLGLKYILDENNVLVRVNIVLSTTRLLDLIDHNCKKFS